MKFLNIVINEKNYEVHANLSVLQVCDNFNIVIPRFCFHPFLSVAGNCRMCLVQIENMPKLQVACAIPIVDNMIIRTNTLAVLKSREGILELLLIFHPLDCAICDAGSECDLQDQSMFYGSDKSKFKEFKKANEDKNCSPLIKTIMTRCILCTRCIRFANEILGLNCLGSIGRGNSLEVSTFINKFLFSGLSGNLIDICPVGALTAKSYRFLARSWELNSIDSIDLFDAIHSNIRVDLRGYEILRVLPRFNESINDVWISDKGRFAYDGLQVQRLVKPGLKKKNRFNDILWFDLINLIFDVLLKKEKKSKIGFYIGSFLDVESLAIIKRIASMLNVFIISNDFEESLCLDFESNFKFNYKLKNISSCDFCCLIGSNPNKEGILLNYHIRKKYIQGNCLVSFLGSSAYFNVPSVHLGVSLTSFLNFLEGKHFFCKYLKNSKKPLFVIGKSFLNNLNLSQLDLFVSVLKKNIGINFLNLGMLNFLSTKTSDFSKYYLGLFSSKFLRPAVFDLVYFFGNNSQINLRKINSRCTVVQSCQGSKFVQTQADIVLASSSYFEKASFYFNLEGILQKANKVTNQIGQSLCDSDILFLLYYHLQMKQHELQTKVLSKSYPSDLVIRGYDNWFDNVIPLINFRLYNNFGINLDVFNYQQSSILFFSFFSSTSINNFYSSDTVTSYSYNMLKCSKNILNKNHFVF
jgi:NADH-quinone oxidoreductase subunit G